MTPWNESPYEPLSELPYEPLSEPPAGTDGRIPTIHDRITGIMTRISGRPTLGRPSRKAYQ
ncbi:hypothetical protein [Streptomyces sp. NPDC003480]